MGKAAEAVASFKENIQKLDSSQLLDDPEKFNLYKGLWAIAEGVNAIEDSLENIEQRLSTIENDINSIQRGRR